MKSLKINKLNNMKLYILAVLSILSIHQLSAQDWYKANVDSIKESGYVNIELSNEILAVSKKYDFLDIRIKDNTDKEIPYFVRSQNPVQEISQFVAYPFIQNNAKDSINTVIIENEGEQEIDRLWIIIRNADVNKYARLRGSNDLKQWYIVKQRDNITYSRFKQDSSSEVLTLDFPKGNYKYYEITLTNDQGSPLDVQKVGSITNSNIYAQLSDIDLGRFVVKDSTDKKTYITFPNQAYNYSINRLQFYVNSKANYLRDLRIEVPNHALNFELSSKSDNIFFIDDIHLSTKGVIIINNGDNPPLTIDSIKAYGLKRYLCAYLEKGKEYTITVKEADGELRPAYDIAHFQNDIPNNLPIIKTADIQKIAGEYQQPTEREKIWIEQPIVMWSIIIIVGLLLMVICYKMIKEMNKKKE